MPKTLQLLAGEVATYASNTDYCGNVIYENNVLKRILVDGGYYENGIYYFYLTDHLGNNRVVANQSGAVIQSTQYYPFGMAFADGTNPSSQPYKFGGKELDSDRGLNLYDFHARWQDAALGGRFLSVDPLTEKYYSVSPYVYCMNNPMRFVDPDGREIWIYYEDEEGEEQKMRYQKGMEYKGNNIFVSSSISFLNAIYSNGAKEMLDVLISSSNNFNMKNLPATDNKGNAMLEAFQFAESATGGGDLYAAAFGNPLVSTYNKIAALAHELFHGLQHEKGQGGVSVFNEVEANVYSAKVALNWMSNTAYVGPMGTTGLGNQSAEGMIYQNAFESLMKGFSQSDFTDAFANFKTGSAKNASGVYNSYPLKKNNQKNSILELFYP